VGSPEAANMVSVAVEGVGAAVASDFTALVSGWPDVLEGPPGA